MAADHYLTAGTQVLLTRVTSTCIKYSSEGQTRTMYHSATPSLAAKALCSSVVPWARWEEGKLWSGRVRSVLTVSSASYALVPGAMPRRTCSPHGHLKKCIVSRMPGCSRSEAVGQQNRSALSPKSKNDSEGEGNWKMRLHSHLPSLLRTMVTAKEK